MPGGRTPKPTALKELEGNPGKRPIKQEPEPSKGAPKMPSHLRGEALAEWGRIVPDLDRIGMLAKVDRAALVAYCEAWATYSAAMEMVASMGPLTTGRDGNLVKNPAYQVARDAADQMMKWGARFGLTPADRVRLAMPAAEAEEESEEGQVLRLLS